MDPCTDHPAYLDSGDIGFLTYLLRCYDRWSFSPSPEAPANDDVQQARDDGR